MARGWDDVQYEKQLKSRIYKEQKAQGLIPTKGKLEPASSAKAEKPKTSAEADEFTKGQQEIQGHKAEELAKAKAAREAGDLEAAAKHEREAADWQEAYDLNEKDRKDAEARGQDFRANASPVEPPPIPGAAALNKLKACVRRRSTTSAGRIPTRQKSTLSTAGT